jgi:hypothetical protein
MLSGGVRMLGAHQECFPKIPGEVPVAHSTSTVLPWKPTLLRGVEAQDREEIPGLECDGDGTALKIGTSSGVCPA